MYPTKESFRFNQIEDWYNANMEDLLYQMHWSEDMMHREIGEQFGIPRPTITKWFKLLNIPSQSCHRFTDKNLTSWLYKTGKLKKKVRIKGPDKRVQRTKENVNVDFFKKWSPEMAYVLGFFSADVSIATNSGGSKYIYFDSTDCELLKKIRKILDSKHKIGLKRKGNSKWKNAYRLQIGSKEMYNDLLKLGFIPNKDLTMTFPAVPKRYISDFTRGFFDGDGSISFGYYPRKDRNNAKYFVLSTVFSTGSRAFLKDLSKALLTYANTGPGCLGKKGKGGRLAYSARDSVRLFDYMYKGVCRDKYLERKYNKFRDGVKSKLGGVA